VAIVVSDSSPIRAFHLGLNPTGVRGILSDCKKRNLVHQIRPLTERLQTELEFFLHPNLVAAVLAAAGE